MELPNIAKDLFVHSGFYKQFKYIKKDINNLLIESLSETLLTNFRILSLSL